MRVHRSSVCCITCLVYAAISAPACVAGDAADKSRVADIVADIQLVATLYGRFEMPVKAESLPKVALKKVSQYADDQPFATKERETYNRTREKYAADYPLRAVVFAGADEMDRVKKLFFPMVVLAPLDPKKKQAFFFKVQEPAKAIFELQQILDQMKAAEEQRPKEKSKRWQANFDFAQTRVLSDLIFLFEYNFTLGQIRADNLPTLGSDHDGWRINMRPRLAVTEAKAKDYFKDRTRRLKKMQEDYAETPWAYFAEREGRRDLGMEWVAKKK